MSQITEIKYRHNNYELLINGEHRKKPHTVNVYIFSKDKKETILQGPMAKIYLNGNPKTYCLFCQDHL